MKTFFFLNKKIPPQSLFTITDTVKMANFDPGYKHL